MAGYDALVALADRMLRFAAVPRSRWAAVALAVALVAMPLTAVSARIPGRTIVPIEIAAATGLVAGWLVLDRLAAIGISIRGGAVFLIAALLLGPTLVAYASRPFGVHLGEVREWSMALGFVLGGLVRGIAAGRRSMASLVGLAAALSWLCYDIPFLPDRPLRDLILYLDGGLKVLHGVSPYITGPVVPTALGDLPFIYPPLTIPLFELVAAVPRPVGEALWSAASIAAVAAALWLLGVRGRWLIVLFVWPPLGLGVAVGNVASFIFLLFVLGFRVGASLVVGGVFKPQGTIPALWLVRERRWREIAVGAAVGLLLVLIALPLAGVNAWSEWLTAIRYFQESFGRYPSIQGISLTRWVGSALALVVTIVAVILAFLGRGRNGLARFGLASIIASPTLYLHGLSPMLAGALALGPELLWFVLGIGPWWIGFQSSWLAIAIVFLSLLAARGDDLRAPIDLSPARADMHPLGRAGQVWPDNIRPERVVGRSATSPVPAEA